MKKNKVTKAEKKKKRKAYYNSERQAGKRLMAREIKKGNPLWTYDN